MKSKLRGFGLKRRETKDKFDLLPPAQLDELAQAARDMQDMRNCYDSLLFAAAATANSAYEFSESLREMGSCLVEKTALHDDEESGKLLLMLGKVQFELQKLVDSYRSHIFLTITNPSESLLNELRTVEDMKRQCDEKRNVYEYMVAQQKDKGRSKGGKDESTTLQQLRTAREEYDEEATLCVFRLKSLKQGQSRSLLTQAARHHAAQLNFFQKGLKSLETVEPHVRLITEHQHIDYHFSGLEDDGREDGEDYGEDVDDTNEGRELSFDYRANNEGHAVSGARSSMEVDEEDLSFPQASAAENVELNIDKTPGAFHFPIREPQGGSHSAPIFPDRKPDPVERIRQIQQAPRKSNTYVLPTPIDPKGAISSRASGSVPNTRQIDISGRTHYLSHSSPLEQKKNEKDSGDGHLPEFTPSKERSGHKESNNPNVSTQLPRPSVGGISFPQLDVYNASDNKTIKRKSFSGPITSKPWSMKLALSSCGNTSATELSHQVSGVLAHVANPQPSASPKVSPSTSPPLVSSPRISELHELPRPPGNLAAKTAKSLGPIGHSAPLVRNPELFGTNKISSGAANSASPLPMPPLIVPRSFSIPLSSPRTMTAHISEVLDSSQVPDKPGEIDSPPLTPISLTNMRQAPAISESLPHSGQIRVSHPKFYSWRDR
uniref:BAR domain-containing protein n=1 Tax=Salix viminalis TaxID=40686 RepID=A0A6N2MY93_SALVM